jgi:hypothetical protein
MRIGDCKEEGAKSRAEQRSIKAAEIADHAGPISPKFMYL